MNVMSHPIRTVDDLRSISQPAPLTATDLREDVRPLGNPLRTLATFLLAPVLVILAVFGFVVVLTDFCLFRLRSGHPEPKGLWEF